MYAMPITYTEGPTPAFDAFLFFDDAKEASSLVPSLPGQENMRPADYQTAVLRAIMSSLNLNDLFERYVSVHYERDGRLRVTLVNQPLKKLVGDCWDIEYDKHGHKYADDPNAVDIADHLATLVQTHIEKTLEAEA